MTGRPPRDHEEVPGIHRARLSEIESNGEIGSVIRRNRVENRVSQAPIKFENVRNTRNGINREADQKTVCSFRVLNQIDIDGLD